MTDIPLCPVKNRSFDPFASTLGIKVGHYIAYWVSHENIVCVKLEWGLKQHLANNGVQDPITFLGGMNTSEALVEAALWEIMAMFGLVENSLKTLMSLWTQKALLTTTTTNLKWSNATECVMWCVRYYLLWLWRLINLYFLNIHYLITITYKQPTQTITKCNCRSSF